MTDVQTLPLLSLPDTVVLPGMVVPVELDADTRPVVDAARAAADADSEATLLLAPRLADRLTVLHTDALRVTDLPDPQPTALVANLPYNVAVPVVLHLLATVPTLRTVLVMVQLEVAERLAARPGSKVYGVPSAKAAWYADVSSAGRIGRNVFWPAPNVDSGLVRMVRRDPPVATASRQEVFR